MPDRIEEILKKIHVLLAKAEPYRGSTDKVVISKRDMFNILEELNESVYQVLDQYEATARSKERARLDFEKYQADLITKTKRKTEEVNAASLMYTDNMLAEVKSAIEDARNTFEEEMRTIIERLDSHAIDIDVNRKDVISKLRELSESERYERILEKDRLEERADDDTSYDSEEDTDTVKKAEIVVKIHEPGDTGITMFGKKRGPKKTKEEKRQMLEELKRKEDITDDDNIPDVGGRHFTADDFDLDKEYFDFVNGESQSDAAEPVKESKKSVLDSFFVRNKKRN